MSPELALGRSYLWLCSCTLNSVSHDAVVLSMVRINQEKSMSLFTSALLGGFSEGEVNFGSTYC